MAELAIVSSVPGLPAPIAAGKNETAVAGGRKGGPDDNARFGKEPRNSQNPNRSLSAGDDLADVFA
jgi:hypothetical protein